MEYGYRLEFGEELKGKTLTKINYNEEYEEIYFHTTESEVYKMYYEPD